MLCCSLFSSLSRLAWRTVIDCQMLFEFVRLQTLQRDQLTCALLLCAAAAKLCNFLLCLLNCCLHTFEYCLVIATQVLQEATEGRFGSWGGFRTKVVSSRSLGGSIVIKKYTLSLQCFVHIGHVMRVQKHTKSGILCSHWTVAARYKCMHSQLKENWCEMLTWWKYHESCSIVLSQLYFNKAVYNLRILDGWKFVISVCGKREKRCCLCVKFSQRNHERTMLKPQMKYEWTQRTCSVDARVIHRAWKGF